MKTSTWIGLTAVLAGLVLLGFGKMRNAHAEQEKNEVARITARMKTVCAGRFLIDVPADAQVRLVRPNIDGFDITDYYDPDQIERLPMLVAKLVPKPADSVPQAAGFCIDQAFVRDPLTAEQGEQITMFAHLPGQAGIEFLLSVAAGGKPDKEGVLERSAAAEERLPIARRVRISRLRAAPRSINGVLGEELLGRGTEEDQSTVYSFWWKVNGTEDDVLLPHLVLKMKAGTSPQGTAPDPLTKDVAIGVWDKISSSLRLKPVSQPARASGNRVST